MWYWQGWRSIYAYIGRVVTLHWRLWPQVKTSLCPWLKGHRCSTKLIVKDSVRSSIERALLNAPVLYPYIEMMNKSFIIQTGQNSFVKENLFGTESVRRLTLCMTTNEQFRGRSNMDALHYQTFRLERLEIIRGNGVPVPGTALDMKEWMNESLLQHNLLFGLCSWLWRKRHQVQELWGPFCAGVRPNFYEGGVKEPHIVPRAHWRQSHLETIIWTSTGKDSWTFCNCRTIQSNFHWFATELCQKLTTSLNGCGVWTMSLWSN